MFCVVCCFFLAEEFDWLFNCRFHVYNTGTIAGEKMTGGNLSGDRFEIGQKVTLQITSQTESSDLFLPLSSLCP